MSIATQTYLASSSTITDGVNEVGIVNILTLDDGALKTETVPTAEGVETFYSSPQFSIPNDQLIIDAIQQLEINTNVAPDTYVIKDTQYFNVPNTIKKEFIIKGTIIDFYQNIPIKGANVILPLPGTKFNTKTDKNGKFTIKAIYPVNKNTEVATLRPPILVTAEGYIPKKLTPYALDQTVREDLNTTQLKSTEGLIEEEKAKVAKIKKKTITLIQALKASKLSIKILIKSFISVLKKRLIPFILALLGPFLIGKIGDILASKISIDDAQGECPSPEEVARIRAQRNKTVRELNNIYSIVDTALTVAGILGGLAIILKVAASIIKNIPLPTSVPPGVGFPTSLILKFQELITKLEGVAEKVITISLGISAVLLVLSSLLLQALRLLKLLDQQLERCSAEGDLEAISFEAILIDEESQQPGDDLVNGFKLGIQTDNKTPIGELKRRFATATNAQGVVILKGEPSFSASEQILKDELAFYIRSNNLKAN